MSNATCDLQNINRQVGVRSPFRNDRISIHPMTTLRLLSALLLGSALAVYPAPPDATFTIDQVMGAPFASSPIAAPKGATMAWLINDQGRRNIWMASAPDWHGRKVTAFDQDDGQEIDELAWAPDGSYLLFTRGGDFETHRENPNPDLSPLTPRQEIWSVAID